MLRLLHTTLLLTTFTVGFLTGERAEGAPVTLFVADMDGLYDLSSTSDTEAANTAKPKQQKPATPVPPAPEPDHDPVADGLSGGSMSAPSSQSTGGGSGATPAAMTPSTPLVQCLICGAVHSDEWLCIPPRFLDGVFRPPRLVAAC